MQSPTNGHRRLRSTPALRDLRNRLSGGRYSRADTAQWLGEGSQEVHEMTSTLFLQGSDTTVRPSTSNHHRPRPYLTSEPGSWEHIGARHQDGVLMEAPVPAPTQQAPGDSIIKQSCPRTAILKEIRLPLFLIQGSMLVILSSLVIIISAFRMRPNRGLFMEPPGWNYVKERQFILLTIPASMNTSSQDPLPRLTLAIAWLTFVTARVPQFAALLSSPLMELWTWRTAQSMVEASNLGTDCELPTPYQLSLLIGICMASFDRLRRWTSYRSCRQQRRKSPRSPVPLVQAGRMLYFSLFMVLLAFAADTLIHYTTSTVLFHQVVKVPVVHESGRGLSEQCLSMSRAANFGFPCSLNGLIPTDKFLKEQNEVFRLQKNSSQASEIQMAASDDDNIALLLPWTSGLSPYDDFRASTIGIATRCKPISHVCNFEASGPNGTFSRFNCSSEFWGTLGRPVNASLAYEPDVPPLAFVVGDNIM